MSAQIGAKLGVEKTGDGELSHMLERTDIETLANAAVEVSGHLANGGSPRSRAKDAREPVA